MNSAVNVDGLQHFVWEAAQDTTLIILMVAAVVSLAAEMWSQVLRLNLHLHIETLCIDTRGQFITVLLWTSVKLDINIS